MSVFHDVLEEYSGQNINVILDGGSAVISGRLVSVSNEWITLSNTNSTKQYIDINKIASFYCDCDKVEA